MARKPQENPALDMTPMIDVVFELIIFFVVTLTEAERKDETIELADSLNGIVIKEDELPPGCMTIDVSKTGRISIAGRFMSADELERLVKDRKKARGGLEFPVLIRADFEAKHELVAKAMDACTHAGLWKVSFVAVNADRDEKHPRKRLQKYGIRTKEKK